MNNISGKAFVVFDKDGKFLRASKMAYAILPILKDHNDFTGDLKSLLNYMFDNAADYDESLRNAIDSMRDQFRNVDFSEIVRVEDGRLFLAEAVRSDVGYTVLFLKDISMVKQREDYVLRLSDFNHQLYQAIEAATTGIVLMRVKDGAHEIIFANRALCSAFRIDRKKVLGQKIQYLFMNVGSSYVEKDIQSFIRDKRPGDMEVCIDSKDSESGVRWYNLTITPVEEGDGDLCVCLFNETTINKMREAEFLKAQKLEALGQMAAGVSHDFNNVLSVVDGYARIAADSVEVGDPIAEHMARIRKASQRGANLVKQMLTFSRHKIVVGDVIELNAAVVEQEMLFSPLMDARVRLEIIPCEDSLVVECTADDLSQIMMNLVVNARDAMPDGGKLSIKILKLDKENVPPTVLDKVEGEDFACIKISDTGEGMDDELITRIFDPFFTTKEQGKGTGLGLSMVYGLVKQMGGLIDVESVIDEGTEFSIYIPLSDRTLDKDISGGIDDIENIELKGYTALVAEDEPDLRALVVKMLEDLGMEVLVAENGNDALLVQDEYEGTIDLLLTDIVMPELNGIELANLMTSLRPDTKVIYMSGYPANGQMARVEIPDDACFLAKPVQYEVLVRLIWQQFTNDGSGEGVAAPHWKSEDDIAVAE